MEEFKNLKEIIELCNEELNKDDINVNATLDLEDLKELQNLINKYKEQEKERDEIYADYQDLGKEKLQLEEKLDRTLYELRIFKNEYVSKNKIRKLINELNGYIEKWRNEKDKPKEQCNKEIMRLTAEIGILEALLIGDDIDG